MDTNDFQRALNELDEQHDTAWLWEPGYTCLDIPFDSQLKDGASICGDDTNNSDLQVSDLESFIQNLNEITYGSRLLLSLIQFPQLPQDNAKLELVDPYLDNRVVKCAKASLRWLETLSALGYHRGLCMSYFQYILLPTTVHSPK